MRNHPLGEGARLLGHHSDTGVAIAVPGTTPGVMAAMTIVIGS
jgi:hypothetical protein